MKNENRVQTFHEGYQRALKSGYLKENYRIFHLRDQHTTDLDYHYHDFSKIVIMLSGKVTYMIEGHAYLLNPWDVLLVNRYETHKPIVDTSVVYERIVIWVKNEYIDSLSTDDCNVSFCFGESKAKEMNIISTRGEKREKIQRVLMDLEEAKFSNEFGASVLADSLFTQLLIMLNRFFSETDQSSTVTQVKFDKQIAEIIDYINDNLGEDLSNESIAEHFFMSKYYLMHKFKEETGYTLHNYIVQKRLINSVELIKKGVPIIKATEASGFNDYSSFLRAYKKRYNSSPREAK